MKYIITIVGAVLLAFVFLLCLVLIDKKASKKRANQYLNAMEQHYKEDGIKSALLQALTLFRDNSLEANTITMAVNYLDKSILRDYKTALSFVERAFPQREVKELHTRMLQDAQQQAAISLAPGVADGNVGQAS